jgi:hypothetical protein
MFHSSQHFCCIIFAPSTIHLGSSDSLGKEIVKTLLIEHAIFVQKSKLISAE